MPTAVYGVCYRYVYVNCCACNARWPSSLRCGKRGGRMRRLRARAPCCAHQYSPRLPGLPCSRAGRSEVEARDGVRLRSVPEWPSESRAPCLISIHFEALMNIVCSIRIVGEQTYLRCFLLFYFTHVPRHFLTMFFFSPSAMSSSGSWGPSAGGRGAGALSAAHSTSCP